MILICKCNHDFKFYVFSSNFIVHIVAPKMDWFRKASAWINILSYFLFCLVYYLKVWNMFNFCNLNKKKLYYLSILQFLNWVKLKIKLVIIFFLFIFLFSCVTWSRRSNHQAGSIDFINNRDSWLVIDVVLVPLLLTLVVV